MKRTYKFRIYPTKSTAQKASEAIELCRQVYNLALEQRILAHRQRKLSISYYDQCLQLPELKNEFPEFKQVPSQALQDVIERLDKAFKNFFLRVKQGLGKGFPRFKGFGRYNSLTLKQAGWKLEDEFLIIPKFGRFKIKFHRLIPKEAKIKTVTVKKSQTGKWFVNFSCDNIPTNPLPETGETIAFDVGCEKFLTDSNGLKVENPRFIKKSEKKLKRIQRHLSRQKKCSNRRKKTKINLAKTYEKVCNQRKDFQYKVVKHYIKHYDTIIHEDMKSWNTKWKQLNKSIRDVSWFSFFNILTFKAEEAGRKVVKVDPRNTSQMCSQCGELVKKDLSTRVHECPFCGCSLDRDFNAALNILRLGTSRRNSFLVIPRSPML